MRGVATRLLGYAGSHVVAEVAKRGISHPPLSPHADNLDARMQRQKASIICSLPGWDESANLTDNDGHGIEWPNLASLSPSMRKKPDSVFANDDAKGAPMRALCTHHAHPRCRMQQTFLFHLDSPRGCNVRVPTRDTAMNAR